jgi:predicted metal-dependent hydrolase
MNAVKQVMEPDGFDADLPVYMQMVEWHLVEELEHRTVAFDVYDHVGGGYLYRLVVGAWAQWHFTRWIRRVTAYRLKVSPAPKRSAKEMAEQKKASRLPRLPSVRGLLPGLLRIYLPSYTPHDVTIAPGIQALADKYSEMAIETP